MRYLKTVLLLLFFISSVIHPSIFCDDRTDPVQFAIIPDAPPVSYLDDSGSARGYLVDLFSSIMTELEIPFEIVPATYSEIQQGLISGELDLFGGMIRTDEREKTFYFSQSGLPGGWGQFFTGINTPYENIHSLRNQRIGLVIGDETGNSFSVFMEKLDIPFIPVMFFSQSQLLDRIESGDLYGGVLYSSTLIGIKNIKITPTVFSPQPVYPVTHKDNVFRSDLDRITLRMEQLKEDPDSYYYTLQNKWLSLYEDKKRESQSILTTVSISTFCLAILLIAYTLFLKKSVENRTAELKQSETIFNHSIEGIMLTDKHRKIIKVNRAFETITGYQKRDVIGRHVSVIKAPEENQSLISEVMKSLEKNGKWSGEMWDRKKSGEVYPLHKSIVIIKDKNGEVINYSFVFSDLTVNRDLEYRLHYISNYDRQTDLPNKTLFSDRLTMAGVNCDREGSLLCVISLGLDNFKKINRSYGSETGDEILKLVGRRLKQICRRSDTVSRYGGDEFTVLLTDIKSRKEIIRIIEKIGKEMDRPYLIGENEIFSSITQGISIYPTDGTDVNKIPRNANQALHMAKKTNKGSYLFYSEEDDILLKKRHSNEMLLRSALKKNEIYVHYQPKFNLKKNRITGVEALVRWKRGGREMVYPNDFISILEETGLIIPVGDFVMKQACTDINSLNQTLGEPLKLAVNLSGVQFSDPLLIEKITETLAETGLPAELLELEITESIAMHNRESTLSILEQLTSRKISIAVDDFGTGYSSLSYLKKFPLSTLKIDKSFIDEMESREEDKGIVKTIISLAEIMNLNVVAEGVERNSQIEILKENLCDEAQGYLISKPADLKSLREMLTKEL